MKLSYYSYCLKNVKSGEKIIFDLSEFLTAFTQLDNIKFKSQFTYNGENLYLLHNVGNTFLFLMTRSNEVIKKIDTQKISISELHELLQENEQFGFASYVLFKPSLFGFASTFLAPRCDAFVNYINQLISQVTNEPWEMVPNVLMRQATKADAISMSHLGRTTIEVDKQNRLIKNFFSQLSADIDDTIQLEGVEIIIKPTRSKNIKPLVDKVLNNITDEGVKKLVVKAKDETMSNLQDLYLISKGAITDNIDKSKEEKIPELLESKCEQNQFVAEKLKEYLADEHLTEKSVDAIQRFNTVSAWSDRFPVV